MIVLNDFSNFLEPDGYTTLLHLNDEVHFYINGSNYSSVGSQHSIAIKGIDISTNSVVITIASTPRNYTLYLNSSIDIDVDQDGRADIRVTLVSLTASSAKINFVSLSGPGGTRSTQLMMGI